MTLAQTVGLGGLARCTNYLGLPFARVPLRVGGAVDTLALSDRLQPAGETAAARQ